jgi:hypothetical protein
MAACVAAAFVAAPVALQGCAVSTAPSSSSSPSEGEIANDARPVNVMRWHSPEERQTLARLRNESAPAGAHLTYNGGRVNSATNVVLVLWGSGSYESHVTSTATPSMLSFYNQVLSNGSYASWLNGEYNTVNNSYNGTKTNQNIGNGSASQVVTITPSSSSTTVDDTKIQSELTAQINAGHLPAPAHDAAGNATTYYAVFFPHGVTVTQGGSSSCVAGGFCAYHGTVAASGSLGEYYYGVHPDMQSGSGCDTGCGSASSAFGNYTSVASHELTEMITDAEVGIAGNGNGPPLAWYDNTNGEIGDICNASQANYVGCDGQTYVLQQEFSNAQQNCINVPSPTSCGGTTPDFTIADSSATIAAGSSGTSTVTTTRVGAAGTVSLSLGGVPAGVTASVSPTSVAAGGSATVSIAVASTVAAGSYSITVTGTEGTKTHASTIPLTVTTSGGGGGGGIANGGFEAGSLSGWTASGASETVLSSGCHGGAYCAQLGSTTPTNGDSSITQQFTAPAGTTGISLWYKESCPDTVTYDWALVTLADNTAGTTATLLAKRCASVGWTNVTGAITAGHTYTLTLTSHDDNYAGDPTYTVYDDVALTTTVVSNGVTNGDFETGSFSGWTTSGASSKIDSSGCHGGTYCAQLGSTSPTNGDSSAAQTFTVPAGKSTLSLYYKVACPDTVTYDWALVTLKDNTAGTTTTLVSKTCTNGGSWVNKTATVTAGHSYTLTLTSHDDNYAGDPTYTMYDDVTLQ